MRRRCTVRGWLQQASHLVVLLCPCRERRLHHRTTETHRGGPAHDRAHRRPSAPTTNRRSATERRCPCPPRLPGPACRAQSGTLSPPLGPASHLARGQQRPEPCPPPGRNAAG